MAERQCSVAARDGGEGNEKWTDEPVGQADVGSSHGLQRQDDHGVWLRGQAASDECPPRGRRFLKSVRHCSSPFSYPINLTARINSV